MIPNVKPSVVYPVQDHIAAQAALAAAGNRVTGWKQVTPDCKWIIVQLYGGALGGGSLQVDLLQATSNAGAGSKALYTNLITSAVDNTDVDGEMQVDFDPLATAALDYNNGFVFVEAKVTNTGGTGAFFALALRMGPAAFVG